MSLIDMMRLKAASRVSVMLLASPQRRKRLVTRTKGNRYFRSIVFIINYVVLWMRVTVSNREHYAPPVHALEDPLSPPSSALRVKRYLWMPSEGGRVTVYLLDESLFKVLGQVCSHCSCNVISSNLLHPSASSGTQCYHDADELLERCCLWSFDRLRNRSY